MTGFSIISIEKGSSTEIAREKYLLNKEGISNWLINKNIIKDTEALKSFQDLMPWARMGGETYSSSFKFTTNKQTKQIFIKAIVTTSPEKSLLDWKRRREILFRNGIAVSNWYHHSTAIIIEDFYPNSSTNVDFKKILTIGYKLDQLGFSTLKFTDDIRADLEGNPFFVDFGFDLGEPSNNMKLNAKDHMIKKYPEKKEAILAFYNRNTPQILS